MKLLNLVNMFCEQTRLFNLKKRLFEIFAEHSQVINVDEEDSIAVFHFEKKNGDVHWYL
jgi:uncharacterized pyridoxamine 5'-phosphate oxidase family protein